MMIFLYIYKSIPNQYVPQFIVGYCFPGKILYPPELICAVCTYHEIIIELNCI